MPAPTCTDCGTDTPVHVVMKPGRDKLEWWLCVRCYLASVLPEPMAEKRQVRR